MAKKLKPKVKKEEETSSNAGILIGVGALLAVILLGALLYSALADPSPIDGVVELKNLSRTHDAEVTYPFADNPLPPAGGLHNPIWQTCDVYDQPILSEHAIHSLEHGVVWITYQPDLAEREIQGIRDIALGNNFYLVSPYPNLQSPIVLTAWGVQLEVDSIDDNRVQGFIDRYLKGPNSPEPLATCDGGVITVVAEDAG